MRVFYFTEQPYPEAWLKDAKSLRISLPNELCDPAVAADRYHDYLDQWMLADRLGLDIMVNEHHSTATCVSPSVNLTLGILARITKRARLLSLGVPLPNRPDPLRVAEEMSVIDVLSRGRLEMGFVKSVAYEVPVALTNPVRMMDRLWEAHDLILKAMTTRNGPFSWEGEHFHYRNVNIWPRPFQTPHPPVWITASSTPSVRAIAQRGYVVATFMSGYGAKALFDTYREVRAEMGQPPPAADRFGYCALVAIADSEAEAMRRADLISEYVRTTAIVSEQFKYPPGYAGVEADAKRLQLGAAVDFRTIAGVGGRRVTFANASSADLVASGCMFAGTPAQVVRQILDFSDALGGIGNFLLMGHGGLLSQADALDNIRLLGERVLPALRAGSANGLAPEAASKEKRSALSA